MKLFRTDEQGTIIAESDGTNLVWNMSPTDSWKAGEPAQSSSGSNNDSSSQSTLSPVPEVEVENEPAPQPQSVNNFAVNGRNGKIHIAGACSATGNGKNVMKQPVYFATFK